MLRLTTADLSGLLTDRQRFVHFEKRRALSILQRKPVKDKQWRRFYSAKPRRPLVNDGDQSIGHIFRPDSHAVCSAPRMKMKIKCDWLRAKPLRKRSRASATLNVSISPLCIQFGSTGLINNRVNVDEVCLSTAISECRRTRWTWRRLTRGGLPNGPWRDKPWKKTWFRKQKDGRL